MPGLVPGIHVLGKIKSWMAGTSPAMTVPSIGISPGMGSRMRPWLRYMTLFASAEEGRQ